MWHGREQCEIDTQSVPGGSQRKGLAFCYPRLRLGLRCNVRAQARHVRTPSMLILWREMDEALGND